MCCAVLCQFSCFWLFVTPWTTARQASVSTGCSRQEYWNGLPFPLSGDIPNPGMKLMYPTSPALQADSLPLSHRETHVIYYDNESIPHGFLMPPNQRQTLSRGYLITLNKVSMKFPKFISFPFNNELLKVDLFWTLASTAYKLLAGSPKKVC